MGEILQEPKLPYSTDHPKFYIADSIAPFIKDELHDFKSDLKLTEEDPPSGGRQGAKGAAAAGDSSAARHALSCAVNAFLNADKEGGTVYIGILDDGTVRGLKLLVDQKQHVMSALTHLLGTLYSPPVPPARWLVRFVPVLGAESEYETFRASNSEHMREYETTGRSHRLVSNQYCWCDLQSENYEKDQGGWDLPRFVVEVVISPATVHESQNFEGPQFHMAEDGYFYRRRGTSIKAGTLVDAFAHTRQAFKEHYHDEITDLEKAVERKAMSCKQLEEELMLRSGRPDAATIEGLTLSNIFREMSELEPDMFPVLEEALREGTALEAIAQLSRARTEHQMPDLQCSNTGRTAPSGPAQARYGRTRDEELDGGDKGRLEGGEEGRLDGGDERRLDGGDERRLEVGHKGRLGGGDERRLEGGDEGRLGGGEEGRLESGDEGRR